MEHSKAGKLVAELKPSDLKQAYSGHPGCACGCQGKYYEQPKQLAALLRKVKVAALADPYVFNLNDVQVDAVGWNVADDLQYVTATVTPKRVYTIYLTAEARGARGVIDGYFGE